jgi:SAM-dependent methyltransferase
MNKSPRPTGSWNDREQVDWYLNRIDRLEARRAGEQMLVDILPPAPRRALDLGCGDGRLAALLLQCRPSLTEIVCVDRSPPMLELARERFAGAMPPVRLLPMDLRRPLDEAGTSFDVVVSGFAIHHLEHDRKRTCSPRWAASWPRAGSLRTSKSWRPRAGRATSSSWPRSDETKTTPKTVSPPSTPSASGCEAQDCAKWTASGGGAASRSWRVSRQNRREPGFRRPLSASAPAQVRRRRATCRTGTNG